MSHMTCSLVTWRMYLWRWDTEWQRLIDCLIIFCKRATNNRALFGKMTYTDKTSNRSLSPSCVVVWCIVLLRRWRWRYTSTWCCDYICCTYTYIGIMCMYMCNIYVSMHIYTHMYKRDTSIIWTRHITYSLSNGLNRCSHATVSATPLHSLPFRIFHKTRGNVFNCPRLRVSRLCGKFAVWREGGRGAQVKWVGRCDTAS